MIASRLTAIGSVCLTLALAAAAGAAGPSLESQPSTRTSIAAAFQGAHPGTEFYRTDGRITTVYGRAFSQGMTPVASAEAFLNQNAEMFGIDAADLVPGSLAGDGLAVREIMPDLNDGHLRFTLVSYLQVRDGVPVYRGDLRLLVRNEDGFPLVLARSGLREVGGFAVDGAVAAAPNLQAAFDRASEQFPGIGGFTVPGVVVWAGTETEPAVPALAVVFEGSVGTVADEGYQKWRILADAASGQVLYTEDLIRHIDVTGSVKGLSTPGKKADICETEVLTALPYARASIGATVAYADVNGNFTIPNAGSGGVTVTSGVRGKYFQARNSAAAGADPEIQTLGVTPPGPANFTHNAANSNATFRSGVNAYIQANIVRDYALNYCPTYPVILDQTEPNASVFPVNINVSGTCNAFYDGASINFYAAGGTCPSTAFGDVVHHEYGHHLVDVAGSGQGQYGEGTGDCVGVLIGDDPILAYGFRSDCAAGIRTAANSLQYPQDDAVVEIHTAGQLISGCVWSTRNALIGPYPSTYRDILSSLAINAILLHAGDLITPQITIDYLTLDDDNAYIGDGTPHYCAIAEGFGAHNMDAPALTPVLNFSFPGGVPAFISPTGGVEMTVQVSAGTGTPQANTGVLYVDPENDGTFGAYPMNQISANLYEASFPPSACGGLVNYYFGAQTTTAASVVNPTCAPGSYSTIQSAVSITTAFSDDFQNNLGWTATFSGATTGFWDRGVPADINGAAPLTDYDGSGQCFLTDNRAGSSVGSYDIDGGSVFLTSPTMDASGGEAYLSYARWYSNSAGADPNNDTFLVEVSNNNGGSWTQLELVGPAAESNGGWYSKSFKISDTLAPTATMKVRFTARDLGNGSVVEAAVDAVKIEIVNCYCPADFNQDGFVDPLDYNAFINAFESSDMSADFNGDGFLDPLDYNGYINAFEAGC